MPPNELPTDKAGGNAPVWPADVDTITEGEQYDRTVNAVEITEDADGNEQERLVREVHTVTVEQLREDDDGARIVVFSDGGNK